MVYQLFTYHLGTCAMAEFQIAGNSAVRPILSKSKSRVMFLCQRPNATEPDDTQQW